MPNTPNNNPKTQNSLNVDEFVAKIEEEEDPNVKSIIVLLKLVSDNIEDSRIKEILESQSDFLRNIVIDSATAKESRALAEDFLSKKASDEIGYSLKQYIYRVGNLLSNAFSEDLIQSLQTEEPEDEPESVEEQSVDETELEEEPTEDDAQAESVDKPDVTNDETYSEEEPAENNEAIGPLSIRLIVVNKNGEVLKEKTFNQDVIKIGSLTPIDSSHLYIDNPDISRMHAVIDVHKNGDRTIIDLGSETGIMVNGTKVLKALLSDGDIIQIGSVEIQFSNLLEAIKDKTEEVNFYRLEIQKLVEANNLQEALDLSQEVLKDHPNAEVLYFNAANIAEKMDDKRTASDFYKKLVVLTESDHMRRLAESRIQRLEEEIAETEEVDSRLTLPSPPPEFDDDERIGEEDGSLVNGAEEDETESDTEETGESELSFRVSFMPDAPKVTEQPDKVPEVMDRMLREMNGESPEPVKSPLEPLPGPSDRSSILPLEREDYILFSDEQIAKADQALHWDMIIQLREGFEETKKDIDPSAQPGIQGLKEHLEYVEGEYKKKFSTSQPPVESGEGNDGTGGNDGGGGEKAGDTFIVRRNRFVERFKKDREEDNFGNDLHDMRADRGGKEEIEEVDDKDIEDIIEDPESIEEDKSKTDSRLIIEQMPVTEELDMLKIGKPLNVEEDNHVRVFNALSGNKITVENNAVVTIDILFSNVNIQLDENNSFVVINKTSKNCQDNPVEIIVTGKEKEGFNPVILGPKASKEHISVLYLG
jgi:pSer/pThr/pTyr-binding forkhead associated (FHA) protein